MKAIKYPPKKSSRSHSLTISKNSSTSTLKKPELSSKRSNSMHLLKIMKETSPERNNMVSTVNINRELFRESPEKYSKVASNSFVEAKDTNLYSKDYISYLTSHSAFNKDKDPIESYFSFQNLKKTQVAEFKSSKDAGEKKEKDRIFFSRKTSEEKFMTVQPSKRGSVLESRNKDSYVERSSEGEDLGSSDRRRTSEEDRYYLVKEDNDEIEFMRHRLKLEQMKVRNYVDFTMSLQSNQLFLKF